MTATLTAPEETWKGSTSSTPLNANKPAPSHGGPGGDPPEEQSGDNEPNPHPFDAYWFGWYAPPLGAGQIDLCDVIGWVQEFQDWINAQGFYRGDLYPHRFIIGKLDPGTRKPCDLSRREFWRIMSQFEFLVGKYGLCLSGMLSYSRQLPGKPLESYVEFYRNNRVYLGDTVGRPFRHKLPDKPWRRKIPRKAP